MIRTAARRSGRWRTCHPLSSEGSRRQPWNDRSTSTSSTTLPTSADVVVIGGGALGCSTLYHLAQLGITNSVLLEAHKLTSGTTWHTAGMLWELRHSDTDTRIISHTRDLLLRLEDETGVNPGWINNGGLMIAENEVRLDEYKRLMTLGRCLGVESHILDPEETKKIYPLMNVSDIVGTLYSPRDGTIDPAGYCTALARSAKNAGAHVIEDCPVTGISTVETLLGGKKVTEVHTRDGVIKTNAVVNATGGWSNLIASMVGLELQSMVVEHSYITTDKVPGIEDMPNVRETCSSAYLKLQGDAVTVGGFEINPVVVDQVELGSPFQLYELKWDAFGPLLEGCIHRVPVLETTGIKSTISGPESFTPDHKAVMGEDPNVQGFFHCHTFNSAGMMLSGGCGNEMAKWVAHGRPELDMFAYDVRRLYTPLHSDKMWVIAKAHESYSKRYSIHYPHDEPLAGRGKRLSPLHEVLERRGCVFQERLGWERPGWFNETPTPVQPYDWYGSYDSPLNEDTRYHDALKNDYSFGFPKHHDLLGKECLACRNTAVIFDLSHFGKFYLTGPDTQKAADWIFTADVNRKAGNTVYTCMLNERGRVEADLTVSICDDSTGITSEPYQGRGFYLTTGGPAAFQNLSHMLQEIRNKKWDVKIFDCTNDMAMLSVQGPRSRDILQPLTDTELSDDAFPFSTHKLVNIAGYQVRALRLTFVGELGWELHMPCSSAIPVYERIMATGEQFGLVNAGYRALDSLSCEKGYRHWHADVRPDDTPLEAGLGFTCKLKSDTKFLGRDALEKERLKGNSKKLMTFTLDDPTKPLWGQEGIYRDGESVGFIRRAEYAFTLGRAIAFGYVQMPDKTTVTKDFLKTGKWSIESMGEKLDATIHYRSPFDPSGLRVKGQYDGLNTS